MAELLIHLQGHVAQTYTLILIHHFSSQIWVVMRHQYGISVPVSQMSFHRKASDGVAKCWLFSQASLSAIGQFFSLSL